MTTTTAEEEQLDLSALVGELVRLRGQHDQLEDLRKEIGKQIKSIEENLYEYAVGQGIQRLTIDDDGGGIERTVMIGVKTIYTVRGGKGDSDERQTLLRMLDDLGYGDQIEKFRNIHKRTLDKILAELPAPKLDDLIEKKIISVYNKPEIKVK